MGIHGLTEANFITAAIATAQFLHAQRPHSTAYVVGGSGLAAELYKVGYSITESHPEYVVVGKTANFNFATMRKATQLIDGGAKFIGTNPDLIDPVEGGTEPAAGVILAAIEAATGKKPYIVGKPNSLMMIYARQMLGRACRGLRDDRRPDGHRHRRRPGGRDAHRARAVRGVQSGDHRAVPLPAGLRVRLRRVDRLGCPAVRARGRRLPRGSRWGDAWRAGVSP